jgi:hypothetical protein
MTTKLYVDCYKTYEVTLPNVGLLVNHLTKAHVAAVASAADKSQLVVHFAYTFAAADAWVERVLAVVQ